VKALQLHWRNFEKSHKNRKVLIYNYHQAVSPTCQHCALWKQPQTINSSRCSQVLLLTVVARAILVYGQSAIPYARSIVRADILLNRAVNKRSACVDHRLSFDPTLVSINRCRFTPNPTAWPKLHTVLQTHIHHSNQPKDPGWIIRVTRSCNLFCKT
jgi:hypothetical protein